VIIEAFIPNWASPRTHALALAETLEPFCCKTTVLSSFDVPFSVQWEEAVSKFTGDIFLWAMADIELRDPVEDIFASMYGAYARGDVAMYAPNLDYTAMVYDTSKLRQVDLGLFEVAGTDLIFASLHRDLLELLPPLGCNTHAWAYDYLMTHIAHSKLGKKVVRDYNFMIAHPYGKAYSEFEAIEQQNRWLRSLPFEYQQGIGQQQEMQARTHA
jgi:hypothetical protein